MNIRAKRIFNAIEKSGYSYPELSKITGISKSSLQRYATGETQKIPIDCIEKIALATGTDSRYLMGWDDDISSSERKKPVLRIPVYGQVAAGIPIEAIEDIDDYEEVDSSTVPHGEYMALRIKGRSMEPRMMEGDVVIVRLQDDVDSGDTAVVLVNGGEATCKKIKKTPDGVILISTNPVYEPMFFSNQEIIDLPVRILGKVVELRAKY